MEVGHGPGARWVESRPTRGWRALDWREVWDRRELVWFLAMRDIRARYKQALLGLAWSILQPVAAAVALVLVFRRFIDVPSDGSPYAVFALLGYAAWTYVSSSIGAVTGSLLGDPALVTKVYFPRIVIPIAAIVPGLVDLGVTLAVVAVLMIATGTAVAVQVPLFALVVVLAMTIALGTGLWLSTLNVLYRDVGHGVAFVLQLWFFASPVAYPTSLVARDWQLVYAINPVVGVIDAVRATVLGAPARPAVIAVSFASAAVLLLSGALFFQRLERRFADVI
jgi:lipopolysaccharide transport system permease protein